MNRFEQQVDVLKSVEGFCYSVCVHLLNEEAIAAKAAKAALLDLYRDKQFWTLEASEREKAVQRKAVSRAVEQLKSR
ncbi:hypothetical protein SD71_19840 [Cohnella kolymensis]|uniref:Uncharacterized protein n=1 Tax=Cohnella kolymensis TaxID=1590652 RepID=A0ABR4ZZT5_9BACL|nr:hypothetical protein [Cohnella kolymensis]KIL34306.1 hypothetical protein SD71_19840 [Cohnella kolymensis]